MRGHPSDALFEIWGQLVWDTEAHRANQV